MKKRNKKIKSKTFVDLDLDKFSSDSNKIIKGSKIRKDVMTKLGKNIQDSLYNSIVLNTEDYIQSIFKPLSRINTNLFKDFKLPTLPEPIYLKPVDIDTKWIAKKETEEALIRKLMLKKLKAELKEENFPLPKYSKQNSTLIFRNKSIKMPPDSDQAELCRVIFEDYKSMRVVWDFDIMMGRWDGLEHTKIDLKKVYRAAREVNKKVAYETGIKDLLVINTKEVSVNIKYLK